MVILGYPRSTIFGGSENLRSERSSTEYPVDSPKGHTCTYTGYGIYRKSSSASQDSRPSCEWFPAGLKYDDPGV